MIELTEDSPLYRSTKDEPLTRTDNPTILTEEPIDLSVTYPELKTVAEPEKQVDFGNGIYSLKPSVPIKVEGNKPLYVNIEKLLKTKSEAEASDIISKITDGTLPDSTLQSLILDDTISDSQPIKAKKTKGIINSMVKFIYNLIYS